MSNFVTDAESDCGQLAGSSPNAPVIRSDLGGNFQGLERVSQALLQAAKVFSDRPPESPEGDEGIDGELSWGMEYATTPSTDPLDCQLPPAKLFAGEPNVGSGTSPTDRDQGRVFADQHGESAATLFSQFVDQAALQGRELLEWDLAEQMEQDRRWLGRRKGGVRCIGSG